MELRPFKELIGLSKEKIDAAMAPIRAKQVKAKADLKMSGLESDILDKETKVQEMCLVKDIDLCGIIDILDQIALLERRKDQYTKVVNQLFPGK